MGNHLSAGAVRIIFLIRIGIKLREELFNSRLSDRKLKSLITIIAASKIPFLEEFCHCHLGHFLAVAKDPKFCLAGEHFFAPKQAGFPTKGGGIEIVKDLITETFE